MLSRLVIVDTNSIPLLFSSLVLFVSRLQYFVTTSFSLTFSLSLRFEEGPSLLFCCFRSRSDLDPPQPLSLSLIFFTVSLHIDELSCRSESIFHFLDLSHHGSRECSDHHERSPNCEFSFSFHFLFPRVFFFFCLLGLIHSYSSACTNSNTCL